MANFIFRATVERFINWLKNIPAPTSTLCLSTEAFYGKNFIMPDDPWHWSIDRMVKELCTEDRSWECQFSTKFLKDPIELEKIIREHEMDGFGVLTTLNSKAMDEMGFNTFKQKKWLMMFILQLQQMSPKFNALHARPTFDPTFISAHGKRPLEESSPEMASKRQRLSSEADARSLVVSPGSGIGEELNFHVEHTPDLASESELVMQDAPDQAKPVKQPKRIAPTFVGPFDPDRQRSVSLAAPQVKPGEVFIDDKTGKNKIIPILQPAESTAQLSPAAENFKPGEVFIDDKTGKKRMVVSTIQPLPKGDKSDAAKGSVTKSRSTRQEELLSQGDLGRFKIPVDQIFYGNVAGVEDEASDNFQICGKQISSGRRIYVNSLIKRFLKQDNLTHASKFSRNGKLYSAIIPYPLRLVPQYQQRSFTLLHKSEDGEIHASKETVSKWSELVTDDSKSSAVSDPHDTAADSNELSEIQLGSGVELDFDKLEAKYSNQADDSLLPAFGDSGSEGEYDYETWAEMEKERIEKENGPLERTLLESRRKPITSEEVQSAIDNAISELVDKWQTIKLPKLDVKAWKTYRKYRNNRKSRRRQLKLEIAHLNDDRIPKQRQEIAGEIWTRADQVHKQAIGSMEVTIFDWELKLWEVGILKSDTPPPKPDVIYSKVKREVNLPQGEEMIASESEYDSGHDMDDFLDDDDDMEDVPGDISDDDSTDSIDSEEEGNENLIPKRHTTPINLPLKSHSPSNLLAGNGNDSAAEESTAEEVQLPADPSTPRPKKSKANVIDLTMSVSSLDQPWTPRDRMEMSSPSIKTLARHTEPINLVTPKKKVKTIIKRSRTPIIISDSDSQHAKNVPVPNADQIPPYNETAKIASLNYKTWEDLQDRDRLVITFLQNMTPHSKRLLLIAEFKTDEGFLWDKCKNVLHGLHYESEVPHMSLTEFDIIGKILRLFKIYVECKLFPAFDKYTKLTAQQISSVEAHEKLFPKLREIVLRFAKDAQLDGDDENGDFESTKKKIPALKVSPINENGDGEDESDDEPVPTKIRKRQSPYKKTLDEEETADDVPHLKPPGKLFSKKGRTSKKRSSDEASDDDDTSLSDKRSHEDEGSNDEVLQLTPSGRKKKKRKVVEDLEARKLREDNTQNMEEQQSRRQQLVARFANLEDGPSDDTRRIINLSKEDHHDFIYIDEAIGKKIKDHQINGVRFMWEQIVSGKHLQGCLLAHTMGLGKTMQVITLLVAIARASQSEEPRVLSQINKRFRPTKALVLCPSSLVDNWEDELLMWDSEMVLNNPLKVTAKINIETRLSAIEQWHQSEDPGVLIIGYPMFSQLLANKSERLTDEVLATLRKQLLEGPSIIVADEAHYLKNPKSATSIFASQFKSHSRVAMTGSPLNNNIEEYHTMIDWVAPNYLGPIKEFRVKYLEPIESGLWFDSSSQDRRRSKKMLAVLIRDVAPKVNRANMSVLHDDLPPKKEFVIRVTLTDIQKELYRLYVRAMRGSKSLDLALTKEGQIAQTAVWSWLSMLSLLCNHPACFKEKLKANAKANDSDEDVVNTVNNAIAKTREHGPMTKLLDAVKDIKDPALSNKVLILSRILDESREKGNKVLVFTQSLLSLNYLRRSFKAANRKFKVLEGDTEMSIRQNMVKKFNTRETEVFLISTKAGGLGLNLYAANRVVIFDFKYNPTQEEQAIGRAYRIGQNNPVFVYRFVVAGTFESLVENKAVFKMQLASRVVDRENPLAWAKRYAAEYLADPVDLPHDDLTSFLDEDSVLDKLLHDATTSSVIQSILKTDTFAEADIEHLNDEDQKEIETMTQDNALQRSNPKEYEALLQKRYQEEVEQRVRRASVSTTRNAAAFSGIAARQQAQKAERVNNPIVPQGFAVPQSPQAIGRVSSGPPNITPRGPFSGAPATYNGFFTPGPNAQEASSPRIDTFKQAPKVSVGSSEAVEKTSSAPGSSKAVDKTPSAPGSSKAVDKTPSAPGSSKAVEKTSIAPGSSEAVDKAPSAPDSPKEVAKSTPNQPEAAISTTSSNPATEAISSMDISADSSADGPPISSNPARLPSWARKNISKQTRLPGV